ncbi:MAG: Gfo/Idh/MocA family oxidoreductase [Clostridia bacterium]
MKKLCIGIIGAGMIASQHTKNAIKDGRAEVKWICDMVEPLMKEKMAQFSIPNGTCDYKEILQDPEVDAVIICTPPFTHKRFLFEILDAGKHVLIEKPLCISPDDLPEMIEKVQQIALQHPHLVALEASARYSLLSKKFAHIKGMIQDGKLGEIYYIHHTNVSQQSRPGIEYNPGAHWFLDKAKAGGGPLFDWGEYDFAFHLGLLPAEPNLVKWDVQRINGIDRVPHGAPVFDVEEHSIAMLEFDSGLKYYYEIAMNAHMETRCESRIYGTKGGIKLYYTPWESDELEFFYVDDDGKGKAQKEIIKLNLENEPSQEFEITRHFIDCCVDGVAPLMPVSLVAKHLDIVFKLSNTPLKYI